MKRKLLTLFGLFVALTLTAAPITKETARKKALQFLTERGDNVAASRGAQSLEMQLRDGAAVEKLHVFNVGQKEGFVIVSGDDCTGDLILGYADRGEITTENMPDNLRAWLQGYADQVKWMQEHGVKNDVATARQRRTSKKTISPLLTTQWNQGYPYNIYCPSFSPNGSPAVTGCIATATAQIMYYQAKKHNIVSTTTLDIIPSYKSTNYYWYLNGVQYDGLPAKNIRQFDWDKIDATLTTIDAKEEVAHLMEYVGAAVKMQYGPESEGGSSATNEDVVTALVDYFGYDPDVKPVYHDDYSDNDWVDIVYEELSTNGPVLLGGQSSSSGHAFVVDGYSTDSDHEYFHINWGWGSLSDGYFVPSALKPSSQGAGGSSSSDGYNYNQVAMVNVSPVDDGNNMSDAANLTVNRWEINYSSAEWYNNNYNNYFFINNYLNYLQLSYSLTNKTGWNLNFEWSVALYNGDSFVKLVYEPVEQSYPNGLNSFGTTGGLSFTSKLSDGVYRLVPVSRKKNTSTWYPCIGSDKYYISVTVSNNGNNMTLKNNPPIKAYDANGWPSSIDIENGNVIIPSDVLAIDLTDVDEVITVTPNDNPNTLYFISGKSIPNGLENKNVIQDGIAAMITLADGNDFFSPFDFTASKATYTRQFTHGADGSNGWSTIVLPFDVTAVKDGENPIDWFHNAEDTGKNFWLKSFSSETGSTVNFDFANKLQANTPYIIAVPGDHWGKKWDLTNKDITFEGDGVTVKASSGATITKNSYEFSGVTKSQYVTNCYVMNDEGNSFVINSTIVSPFRAYFMDITSSGSLARALSIGVERGEETAISPIVGLPTQPDTYFNLQGQRVDKPHQGLYIVNGKKVIIK